jgi:hypothetical protein
MPVQLSTASPAFPKPNSRGRKPANQAGVSSPTYTDHIFASVPRRSWPGPQRVGCTVFVGRLLVGQSFEANLGPQAWLCFCGPAANM